MRTRTLRFALAVLVATLICLVQPLRADVTGAILGTVSDPSGAAVPSAKVTLHNADTGQERSTTTDATGAYEFLAVPVGDNYIIEAEAQGFQKSSQSN